jgi:hypothetical protein
LQCIKADTEGKPGWRSSRGSLALLIPDDATGTVKCTTLTGLLYPVSDVHADPLDVLQLEDSASPKMEQTENPTNRTRICLIHHAQPLSIILRIATTAAATIAICLPLSGQTTASTPQGLAARFYTLCIKHHVAGLPLNAEARKALRPLLSEDLRQRIDDGEACQADFIRQFPDPPPVNPPVPQVIYKPPFIDCCLFTSTPDGTPTSFTLGPTNVLRDGQYRVVLNFVRKDMFGVIKWRDAAIVKHESDRFVIDNVVFDADLKPAGYLPQPFSFQGCQGPRWVGGH